MFGDDVVHHGEEYEVSDEQRIEENHILHEIYERPRDVFRLYEHQHVETTQASSDSTDRLHGLIYGKKVSSQSTTDNNLAKLLKVVCGKDVSEKKSFFPSLTETDKFPKIAEFFSEAFQVGVKEGLTEVKEGLKEDKYKQYADFFSTLTGSQTIQIQPDSVVTPIESEEPESSDFECDASDSESDSDSECDASDSEKSDFEHDASDSESDDDLGRIARPKSLFDVMSKKKKVVESEAEKQAKITAEKKAAKLKQKEDAQKLSWTINLQREIKSRANKIHRTMTPQYLIFDSFLNTQIEKCKLNPTYCTCTCIVKEKEFRRCMYCINTQIEKCKEVKYGLCNCAHLLEKKGMPYEGHGPRNTLRNRYNLKAYDQLLSPIFIKTLTIKQLAELEYVKLPKNKKLPKTLRQKVKKVQGDDKKYVDAPDTHTRSCKKKVSTVVIDEKNQKLRNKIENMFKLASQDGKIVINAIQNDTIPNCLYHESQCLFYALMVLLDVDKLENIMKLTYALKDYNARSSSIFESLIRFKNSCATEETVRSLFKHDYVLQKTKPFSANPGQQETVDILRSVIPSIIINKTTTSGGKTAAGIVAAAAIKDKAYAFFCHQQAVLIENAGEFLKLGVKPIIVKNGLYYSQPVIQSGTSRDVGRGNSERRPLRSSHLGEFFKKCAKFSICPSIFLVADMFSAKKLITEFNGMKIVTGMEDSRLVSRVNDVLEVYTSAIHKLVFFWDEATVPVPEDIDSELQKPRPLGSDEMELLQLLTNVPKVVLASATLPRSLQDKFISEWLNAFKIKDTASQEHIHIIDPPCVTLGITFMNMQNELITYHNDVENSEQLVQRIETIRSNSFLQKIYTGPLVDDMFTRASSIAEVSLTRRLMSPLDFFGRNLENVTLEGIREYAYYILTYISSLPDESVKTFCKTKHQLAQKIDPEKLIKKSYQFLGVTLYPSMECELIPYKLLKKKLKLTHTNIQDFITAYYNIEKPSKKNNKKLEEKIQFAQEQLKFIQKSIINGSHQLKEEGVDVNYRFIRTLDAQDVIRTQEKTIVPHADFDSSLPDRADIVNLTQRALVAGCVYYNGNDDAYSKEVLAQLSEDNPKKQPAIVSMKSCVGVNKPFSTVIISNKYANAVTPSDIYQAVSRASRLGKNVLSGRAILDTDAVTKIIEFFQATESPEEKYFTLLHNQLYPEISVDTGISGATNEDRLQFLMAQFRQGGVGTVDEEVPDDEEVPTDDDYEYEAEVPSDDDYEYEE
jgi:hypothetical protein